MRNIFRRIARRGDIVTGAYWESRPGQIAPEVGAYVREVLDSDDVLSMVRTASRW